MKKFLIFVLFVMSCPRPGVYIITPPDYLREAQRVHKTKPLYAYSLIKDSMVSPPYVLERARLLVDIYCDQREYERAAALLDSVNWTIELDTSQAKTILLKTQRWHMLMESTSDTLLLGIAHYYMGNYEAAIQHLTRTLPPDDYRLIYLARAYQSNGDINTAFAVLAEIDSVSPYLSQEYQDLLSDICMTFDNATVVQQIVKKIQKPHVQQYIMLRLYERHHDKKNLKSTAWKLIRSYPESKGARYALQFVKPSTKADYSSFGKVYYFHGNYDEAITHLTRASQDAATSYYLGMSYYFKSLYSQSLNYLSRSNWSAAYYYRGRIYENLLQNSKALAVYDSLYLLHRKSDYATRGYKRKAFLLEDIGDTLQAVEAFLKLKDKNTVFRAALQLFRVGELHKADSLFSMSTADYCLYWRIRTKERLGEKTDDLQDYLMQKHPFSYYALTRNNGDIPLDTLPLELWMQQFRDSTTSFSREDSFHLENATRYFNLNEIHYATEEIEQIDDKSAQDYLYLSRLCAHHTADRLSILYGLKIKSLAEKNNTLTIPRELFELIYPVRYTLSIAEQDIELSLCLAMIWQESLFDPEAVSSANAQGIMQIIPPTAKKIAQDLNVENYNLHDPRTSIRFGCYYYMHLQNDFQSVPLSLAGYNAGPVRVKRWLNSDPNYELDEFIDLIPYDETRLYVKLILARQVIYKRLLNI